MRGRWEEANAYFLGALMERVVAAGPPQSARGRSCDQQTKTKTKLKKAKTQNQLAFEDNVEQRDFLNERQGLTDLREAPFSSTSCSFLSSEVMVLSSNGPLAPRTMLTSTFFFKSGMRIITKSPQRTETWAPTVLHRPLGSQSCPCSPERNETKISQTNRCEAKQAVSKISFDATEERLHGLARATPLGISVHNCTIRTVEGKDLPLRPSFCKYASHAS